MFKRSSYATRTGLEVIKLEFILIIKIKRNDWPLVHKLPINALCFEFETELKFYNLGARKLLHMYMVPSMYHELIQTRDQNCNASLKISTTLV